MSIELRGISKRYSTGAVGADNVDVDIEKGELVALFGSSGSGKTSILHIIGLLQAADSGELSIDGERVESLSEGEAARIRRTKLGFVFQTAGLLPLLSAWENVDVSLRLLGVGGSPARKRVEAALEAVSMMDRASHRPDELSGGEQQRIAIARALVHAPAYLLADEPTGELDTDTGASVLRLLRTIADNGTSVVIASHDPAVIEIVDRAFFVEDGKLLSPDVGDLRGWLTEGTTLHLD